jgi:glutamate synthase domain-containing protein 2
LYVFILKIYFVKRGKKVKWMKDVKTYTPPDFHVIRDPDRCIKCRACVDQCSFDATFYDEEEDKIWNWDAKCVGCNRCAAFCPTEAITIENRTSPYRVNESWGKWNVVGVKKRAAFGGAPVVSMGSDKPYIVYWDHMLINASQVTNPSIDPLREPMELKTFLGKKVDRLEIQDGKLKTVLSPQLEIELPIMFAAMSYGALNYNVIEAMGRAAVDLGTYFNSGEGGLHKDHYKFKGNIIVQVASGRFGVYKEYLDVASAIEIKIGQGAKPGIGGHLPGEKVTASIAQTRMIPKGTDALSPAPHHDIYSIEDLRQLIFALKEATEYKKPIFVKIACVHNIAAIASGVAQAGADVIVLDGFKGGTGASPQVIRDNVGLPIELALASVDDRLRQEGLRGKISLVASGGIRNSMDVVKAIALGADAVYIGTATLIAIGCTMCQQCHTGKCAWGIATQDPFLSKRQNPNIAAQRLVNLVNVWGLEIKETLGAMGINSIESLKGNRLALRGFDLNEKEMEILGILHAGE